MHACRNFTAEPSQLMRLSHERPFFALVAWEHYYHVSLLYERTPVASRKLRASGPTGVMHVLRDNGRCEEMYAAIVHLGHWLHCLHWQMRRKCKELAAANND